MTTIIMLISLGLVLGFLTSHLQYFLYKVKSNLSVLNRQRGYHLHHSLFGVVLYTLPEFMHLSHQQFIFVYALATGIIIDHTLKEGFIFVTKESNDKFNIWFLSLHFLLTMPELDFTNASFNFALDNSQPFSL